MAVKTYDPKQVIVTFGGVPISGFADGTFISVSPNNDRFTKAVGADGEVARSKSVDYSHEVTLTLLQTALSNAYLTGILTADQLTNEGKLPLSITDLSGTTLMLWPEAWIRVEPDVEFAKETGERAWVFDTGQPAVNVIGGNL